MHALSIKVHSIELIVESAEAIIPAIIAAIETAVSFANVYFLIKYKNH